MTSHKTVGLILPRYDNVNYCFLWLGWIQAP